jgi:AMMECR1 domain-containing protein
MNFISVGEGKAEHWVDLEKVETVAVATEIKAAGIQGVLRGDSGPPQPQPTKIFIIKLAMVSGAVEEKRFEDMAEAERFLEGHFGIRSGFKRA